MRAKQLIGLALMLQLTGCAAWSWYPAGNRHTQNSTSLVEYLYPNGSAAPRENAQPQLHLPLRVGLAFLPSRGPEAENGLDAAHKEALLEQIRKRFISRKFVAEIVVIPDYYLRGKNGFAGLEGVQRLYAVDLMALVSYDQVAHQDSNNWSLGYATIVGTYFLKGTRHDVSTLVDLAVVDPATRSLVLRAGGYDNRHGNVALMEEARRLRETEAGGFNDATGQMIEHFDAALTAFEGAVREGKANVRVVSNQSGSGGGGSLNGGWLLALLLLSAMQARSRLKEVTAADPAAVRSGKPNG